MEGYLSQLIKNIKIVTIDMGYKFTPNIINHILIKLFSNDGSNNDDINSICISDIKNKLSHISKHVPEILKSKINLGFWPFNTKNNSKHWKADIGKDIYEKCYENDTIKNLQTLFGNRKETLYIFLYSFFKLSFIKLKFNKKRLSLKF